MHLITIFILDNTFSHINAPTNDPDDPMSIYYLTKMACTKIDLSIPEVKRRKVSTKVDSEHHSQHFFENTKDEMKITVYNSVIDKMLPKWHQS